MVRSAPNNTGIAPHSSLITSEPGDKTGVIRDLRLEDREAILSLVRATGVFTEPEITIAAELIDTTLRRPDQRDYIVRVADRGGLVVGYTCFGPTPGTEGTFDLYWIAVAPRLHGQGVGAALDDDVVTRVRAVGGRMIVAETSSRPTYAATRAFYRRRGYEQAAHIPGYYRPGDDLVVSRRCVVVEE